jgi:hypothetical protein
MMRKSRLETGDREGMPEAGSIPHQAQLKTTL